MSPDVNNSVATHKTEPDEPTATGRLEWVKSRLKKLYPSVEFLEVSKDVDGGTLLRCRIPEMEEMEEMEEIDAARNRIPQQPKEVAEGSMAIDTSEGATLEKLPEVRADSNGTSTDKRVDIERGAQKQGNAVQSESM